MNTTPTHPATAHPAKAAEPNPNNVDTAPSETTPAVPATPAGPGQASNTAHESAAKREGTHVLPMPDDSEKVAGKNRSDRVHTQPGDPGNIAPESQVSTNEKTESQN